MSLQIYLAKNNITMKKFSKMINYNSTYLSRVMLGHVQPGRKLSKLIEEATQGNVLIHSDSVRRTADRKPKKQPDGYVLIYVNGEKIYEHVHLMEKKLGRKLFRGETVHHKNGIKHDNSIENLELWTTRQPSGKRVDDLKNWAKELLETYNE